VDYWITTTYARERTYRMWWMRKHASIARIAAYEAVPRQIHIRTARGCFLTVKAIAGSTQLSEFGGDVFGQFSSVFCLV
jgi:hypothetical protein